MAGKLAVQQIDITGLDLEVGQITLEFNTTGSALPDGRAAGPGQEG